MLCEILIKQTESGFIATVFGFPDCVAEGTSREEAIMSARRKAQGWIRTGEFVQIADGQVANGCDWSGAKDRGVGIFADIPNEQWNDFLAAIKEYRDQIDANPNEP